MNIQKLNMQEIDKGVYAKVVKKGACTAEFNDIIKEVKGGFIYNCISQPDEEKLNGYVDLVKDIEVNYENQNLIIIRYETNN